MDYLPLKMMINHSTLDSHVQCTTGNPVPVPANFFKSGFGSGYIFARFDRT